MIKKTKLALGIATATLAMASTLMSADALAHSKKHHHVAKKHPHSTTTHFTRRTTSSYVTDSTANKVDALEAQLQALQSEINSLRAADRSSAPVESAKVQELDQWMSSVKSGRAETSSKDNMVFFRGGYGRATDSGRGGTIPNSGLVSVLHGAADVSDVAGNAFSNGRAGQDSWYFGAGFDFSLNKDFFGLMNGTEVFAELMFDYKEFSKGMPNSPLATTNGGVTKGYNGLATVNQLTLAASPKVKLFKGQAFRPWIIPVGFELSVISPPSDAITVLNPGMQFGIGADYKVWKDLYVGADARYHYAVDNIDGVNTNGVTAGGYLGIGF
ncbi:MAG: porin family protein [Methylococcaceae bacterium]